MCHITLKTILRKVHPIKGFVYQSVHWDPVAENTLRVRVAARQGCRGICSGCGKKGPGYDRQPERQWNFVPFWGLLVLLVYAPRRIACRSCGPRIEKLPWASGKHQLCDALRIFLAQWARLLSWAEVARRFRSSWADVYSAVRFVVDYGLEHRDLSGVSALGVDEIHVGGRHKFWTLVYQIDEHCKRLLWIGPGRNRLCLDLFFQLFGHSFCQRIRFICSDMWKPYLQSAARFLPNALHILDRFHIVKNLNEALDEIRRAEARSRAAAGLEPLLKKMRWVFLKKRRNWTRDQRRRMGQIRGMALRTLRAFLLVEAFQHFWTYLSPRWAGKFLDAWCRKVSRSRLLPLQKVARNLQTHRALLLNYFEAKGRFSSAVVEGLNAKVKLTFKRSYGFRTDDARQVAMFHALGKLPEPSLTHSFF